MKKFLAMLLILLSVLPVSLASADGAMTDKSISFAEFTFGDTFGNIRKNAKPYIMEFKYGAYDSRCIADAIETLPDNYNDGQASVPYCFVSRERGRRKVAGQEASVNMWFAYTQLDHFDENSAIFYAGEYEFEIKDDADGLFSNLKGKLSQVYGEPFYVGFDISEAMGEPGISEIERYMNDSILNLPEYAVWKSSANNAVVVLKKFSENGHRDRVKLAYISDVADEIFAQFVADSGSHYGESLEGL